MNRITILFLATASTFSSSMLTAQHSPELYSIPLVNYSLKGTMASYIDSIQQNWLMKMPQTNPALLDMFRVRDIQPYKNYLPWSGEFAGKYLTGATMLLRLTGEPKLKTYLQQFVNKLVSYQDKEDGYLGPFKKSDRLTGWDSVTNNYTWEEWNHSHIIMGLLFWYDETKDTSALSAARKIGDMMCSRFLGKSIIRVSYRYTADMNHSLVYGLTLLYNRTHSKKYLDLALQIVKEFAQYDKDNIQGGNYINEALDGKEYFETPRPRWEGIYALLGIGELYYITGNKDYKTTLENFWWSIVKTDRHNNGGFSSGEGAVGNPYDPSAIETCCTVAWVAMSVEMLRLTGNPVVADELELSTLNQVLGYQSPDGKWCTYNTPMDGRRLAGYSNDVSFQSRPGSEEINCCSANAPVGFGYLADWALMSGAKDELILNWYGSGIMKTTVDGTAISIANETDYPHSGSVKVKVDPESEKNFTLKLRIPYWSANTMVTINGIPVKNIPAGKYLSIQRNWKKGDVIEIHLDFSFRYWKGERQLTGKSSVYYGPLLLVPEETENKIPKTKNYIQGDSYNEYRQNEVAPDALTLDKQYRIINVPDSIPSQVVIEIKQGGHTMILRDYGTAGLNGRSYRSWLYVQNTFAVPFTRSNPGRTWRPTK